MCGEGETLYPGEVDDNGCMGPEYCQAGPQCPDLPPPEDCTDGEDSSLSQTLKVWIFWIFY